MILRNSKVMVLRNSDEPLRNDQELTLISVFEYKSFISSIVIPKSLGSFDRPSVINKSSVSTSR